MKSTIENKIQALEEIRKGVNPISPDDSEKIEFYRGLREDGLIEFYPDGKINSSARVRLTSTGEEHLQKLKDQGSRKLLWLIIGAIITGLITLAVRLNS
ncbi:hypothetical protein NB466_14205 [Vibrio fluvialis]|uniref:hypothetical protein n=1 Tax=Vibrio fluvialis TaxID=676 RepID=UPI00215C1F81|nr:hypothetical protein [Vibrio fluvialis]MCR9300019.1 hypothetical protein [Vibrio fluvialis]